MVTLGGRRGEKPPGDPNRGPDRRPREGQSRHGGARQVRQRVPRLRRGAGYLQCRHTKRRRPADPRIAPPHYFLAGAYGLKGELDRAAAELTEAERLTGSDRYSTIARVRANGDLNTPAVRDRFEGVFLAGLRKA